MLSALVQGEQGKHALDHCITIAPCPVNLVFEENYLVRPDQGYSTNELSYLGTYVTLGAQTLHGRYKIARMEDGCVIGPTMYRRHGHDLTEPTNLSLE